MVFAKIKGGELPVIFLLSVKARFFALVCVVVMVAAQPVHACAVCFGDPESNMAKGAVAGVLALAGFIGFVLMGITGTGLFWILRNRQLHRQPDL